MAEPVVQVQGAAQLRATMRRAGLDLADLTATNRATAAQVAPEATRRAPRRTGRLATSVRPGATRTAALIRAGNNAVPYAAPVEFGWPARNIEAQPFIVEAAQATEPQWTVFYQDRVDAILANIHGV